MKPMRVMRSALLVLGVAACFAGAGAGEAPDDGIAIGASKGTDGVTVTFDATGGRPAFDRFRRDSPARLADPSGFVATTRDRSWTDGEAPGPGTCFYYRVVSRWPEFYSSDAVHDERLNHLFRLHARADYADDSLRKDGWPDPAYGTVHLWRDWEVDELLWHDATPMNYPNDDRANWIAFFLQYFPVDRFGYQFSGSSDPEAPKGGPGSAFGMGWPFPNYSSSDGLAVGWEWNAGSLENWTLENAQTLSVGTGEWKAQATRRSPRAVSPPFTVAADQAPFVDLEVQYDAFDPLLTGAEKRFRLEWQTAADPTWTLDKSVASDDFPVQPVAVLALAPTNNPAFHLPMYLHARWKGQTITRLRLEPIQSTANQARDVTWRLNYVRLDYDSRHGINNPITIHAAARKFFWDGDASFLAAMLPRMRRAVQFMLTHMNGDAGGLDASWLAGHDGLAFPAPDVARKNHGHGLSNNWWDIVSMGPKDFHASIRFVQALRAMAEVEAFVEANPAYDSPKPAVDGIDGTTKVPYAETSSTLRARSESARQAIHATFWNPATGRYGGWRDVNGALHDYGPVTQNLEALAAGIPDPASARSILDWLDGVRTVAGDDSTGPDIYKFEFAARHDTRKNDLDWNWGWAGWTVPFDQQVEDGGASLWHLFYDVRGRLAHDDVEGAWRIWQRMLAYQQRIRDFGGVGPDFYRAYYAAHPGEGTLQGDGTPGGLGLDAEFVENMLAPCAWPKGWMGIDSVETGVLRIAPRRPAALGLMGVRGVFFRGNRLDVHHEAGAISLRGSTVRLGAAEQLELVFYGAWSAAAYVTREGTRDPGTLSHELGRLILRTPIGADRFEVVDPAARR